MWGYLFINKLMEGGACGIINVKSDTITVWIPVNINHSLHSRALQTLKNHKRTPERQSYNLNDSAIWERPKVTSARGQIDNRIQWATASSNELYY